MITLVERCRFLAVIGGTLALCNLLHACASSRLLKNPLPPTAPDLDWAASVPEGPTVEMRRLIMRNGGGSWVRDADWDEYVLTIKNDSQGSIEIQRIDLYSDRLSTPEESSTSREQLEMQTSRTLQAMKDVGVVAGAGVVVPAALIAGAATAGGGSVATLGAAAAVGVVAIPAGLIGGTVYVIRRHYRNKEDKVLIENDLMARGFGVPVQIPPGTQIETSAFFPVTPAPTRLVVHYSDGGDTREIPLDLPELAGLHLKAPHSRSVSEAAPGPMH